jgi:hypothetical protein
VLEVGLGARFYAGNDLNPGSQGVDDGFRAQSAAPGKFKIAKRQLGACTSVSIITRVAVDFSGDVIARDLLGFLIGRGSGAVSHSSHDIVRGVSRSPYSHAVSGWLRRRKI